MKKLLIVGAGGHGRCCLDIARSMNCFNEIAFLDDHKVGDKINDCLIVDTISNMHLYKNDYDAVFVSIGNNLLRKNVIEEAKKIGYDIINLISPLSFVSPYSTIGEGTVVFPFACIEANSNVGDGCVVGASSIINHDAKVEEYCLINTNSVIMPNTLIGKNTKIGCRCVVSFGISLVQNSNINDGLVLD